MPGATTPLHRTLNTATQDANNAAARKTCDNVWVPYDGKLLNCDEYPFASTEEGAAKGDGNYSARLIDAGDNQAAGRWLNSNYTLNRILDGDALSIAITP
ncbi:NucA/NucB deoxyribonuclease domain-containing protein [Amycolatopsis pigmentata]|uniref:NucA/NucB deoxyribonuclease domain-containing protein n=1 Tax=Amycolatopsis pigmentata TaxID=450801 RepID=A0ABW5FP46_9PSEU